MPMTFPYSTLKAASFKLDIVANVISGGVTSGGYQQRANTTGGGLWALALGFNRLSTADELRSWRVVQYGSDGGVVPVNIAICDLRQAPRPSGSSGGGVPHSDDTSFSDGSLYYSPQIIASLTADADLRDTVISVAFDSDSLPLGGEYFSLPYGAGYHELHVIIGVQQTDDGFDLTIRPPLRADHTAGTALNFDHPTGTYVLATPDAMSLATEYGRWGRGPQASFIEYLGAQ